MEDSRFGMSQNVYALRLLISLWHRQSHIREWTGLDFGKCQRAVENRGKWRKLVAKLSVVPRRPSWLRLMMMMMMMMKVTSA